MTGVTSNVEDRLANRTVLVADDSEAVRTAFQVLLSLHGARVLGASSPAEALATVRSQEVDLVIQDMNFRREATSGEEGIALFRELRAIHPDVPVILLTAWTHLETAVDLVKTHIPLASITLTFQNNDPATAEVLGLSVPADVAAQMTSIFNSVTTAAPAAPGRRRVIH